MHGGRGREREVRCVCVCVCVWYVHGIIAFLILSVLHKTTEQDMHFTSCNACINIACSASVNEDCV